MRITVFTPTYNRGYIIQNLYHSLQRQTLHDFEWIVVDDGSTDDTEEVFEQFLKDKNEFPIQYIKTKNGGKHRAINKGVSIASGELFLIVDSDDYLTDNALESIDQMERSIPKDKKNCFGGVCGLRGYSLDEMIGSSFDGEIIDITMMERSKYGISGDKAEVFYTSILKKYPFPEYEGENFITECVVWDKIAADGYLLRFFNEVLIICNYLPDGLTAQGDLLFAKNPRGWGHLLYQEVCLGKIQGIIRWNKYLHYFYTMRRTISFREIASNLHEKPIRFWVRLFGIRLFYKLYDR